MYVDPGWEGKKGGSLFMVLLLGVEGPFRKCLTVVTGQLPYRDLESSLGV